MNRVRWLTPPRDIAALVTDAAGRRFQAQLFHFGLATRPMTAELYLLEAGDYEWTLQRQATNERLERRRLNVSGPRTIIRFELPARELCTLRVARNDAPSP
jgi:hypothetical protein